MPLAAFAQTQVVKPPVAQYWMSVETAAGMSIPGMGALGSMIGGMMGGQAGAASGGRRMQLQLGSQRASDAPKADHLVPAGLNMGESLPLNTPPKAQPPRATRGEPGQMEKPKGRMLLYWGCGEDVRPGQPVVLDFAKLAEGQQPPNMVARRVSSPAAPGPSRSRTYGDWPNSESSKAVPEGASLKGEHTVKGNYSPEIHFALGEGQDFMEPVALSHAGGGKVQWKAIAHATGYFATVFGGTGAEEVVFWSSSDVQEMGSALMDYVPPAEVARLIREKVVLAPATTECAVPGEVMKKAGAPFLNFIAYGPEANFVEPPRPKDPKVAWEQVWTAKARFKSTAQLMLGEGSGDASPGRAQKPEPDAAQSPAQDSKPDNPVDQGIRTLRGIFGR